MTPLLNWVEQHQSTVGLLRDLALVAVAWIAGVFSYFQRFRAKPALEIQDLASFVFIQRFLEHEGSRNVVRAAFVINAAVVNASNQKVVVDQFLLGFKALSWRRSFRQKLLRMAFPSRPRKRLGQSLKFMGTWFTKYQEEEIAIDHVSGILEPKEQCGGYLLFVSFTYGDWNPLVKEGRVFVRLRAKLTSRKWLSVRARLRVTEDADYVEEFSPGMIEHLADRSTWHHDLTIWKN